MLRITDSQNQLYFLHDSPDQKQKQSHTSPQQQVYQQKYQTNSQNSGSKLDYSDIVYDLQGNKIYETEGEVQSSSFQEESKMDHEEEEYNQDSENLCQLQQEQGQFLISSQHSNDYPQNKNSHFGISTAFEVHPRNLQSENMIMNIDIQEEEETEQDQDSNYYTADTYQSTNLSSSPPYLLSNATTKFTTNSIKTQQQQQQNQGQQQYSQFQEGLPSIQEQSQSLYQMAGIYQSSNNKSINTNSNNDRDKENASQQVLGPNYGCTPYKKQVRNQHQIRSPLFDITSGSKQTKENDSDSSGNKIRQLFYLLQSPNNNTCGSSSSKKHKISDFR